MKIYIAGKWQERKNVRKCMEELVSMGHEITCDWTDHEYGSDGVIGDLSKFAEDDMEGVRSCDIVIALMTEGYHHKGSLCEMGGAIALGKRVYVIGNAADSCIFINHPLTKKILSVKEIEKEKENDK